MDDRNRASTSATRLRATPPLTENVKRRFPRSTRGGVVPTRISRKWLHPLEAIARNQIFEHKPLSRIGHTIKPISWAPLPAAIQKIPGNLSEAVNPNRGFQAKLLRSPERVIGLGDATRRSGRTRDFNISEAMFLAYIRDHRFILLTCLLIGFGAWWALLPEKIFIHPSVSCSPEYASLLKDALSPGVCPMRDLKFPCTHAGQSTIELQRHSPNRRSSTH